MFLSAHQRRLMLSVICVLSLAACGGDDDGDGGDVDDTSATSAPATADAATTVADTASDTTTPDTTTPGSALVHDGNTYTIDWTALGQPAYFAAPSAGSADPFYHIHSHGPTDGFFFSLELYTTGYGALWTGQLGTFPLGCSEPVPGPNSTGICVHFDPDGPGPATDLNADFAATGSITINQLDASGYSIDVGQITFSDGSVIAPFSLAG